MQCGGRQAVWGKLRLPRVVAQSRGPDGAASGSHCVLAPTSVGPCAVRRVRVLALSAVHRLQRGRRRRSKLQAQQQPGPRCVVVEQQEHDGGLTANRAAPTPLSTPRPPLCSRLTGSTSILTPFVAGRSGCLGSAWGAAAEQRSMAWRACCGSGAVSLPPCWRWRGCRLCAPAGCRTQRLVEAEWKLVWARPELHR
jgi:hypothetical protein